MVKRWIIFTSFSPVHRLGIPRPTPYRLQSANQGGPRPFRHVVPWSLLASGKAISEPLYWERVCVDTWQTNKLPCSLCTCQGSRLGQCCVNNAFWMKLISFIVLFHQGMSKILDFFLILDYTGEKKGLYVSLSRSQVFSVIWSDFAWSHLDPNEIYTIYYFRKYGHFGCFVNFCLVPLPLWNI